MGSKSLLTARSAAADDRREELLRLAYELRKLAGTRMYKRSLGRGQDLRAASEFLEEYALGCKVAPGSVPPVPCPACGGYFRAILRRLAPLF